MRDGAVTKVVFRDGDREKVVTGTFLYEDGGSIVIRAKDTGKEVRISKSALVWLKELDS